MLQRFFPIVYVQSVREARDFYEARLGLELAYRWPAEGEPDFVVLRMGDSDVGLAAASAPEELLGSRVGEGLRFELCVYCDDVDEVVRVLREHAVPVLREPEDMPWGERMAYVADPDGNPVHLAMRLEGGPGA